MYVFNNSEMSYFPLNGYNSARVRAPKMKMPKWLFESTEITQGLLNLQGPKKHQAGSFNTSGVSPIFMGHHNWGQDHLLGFLISHFCHFGTLVLALGTSPLCTSYIVIKILYIVMSSFYHIKHHIFQFEESYRNKSSSAIPCFEGSWKKMQITSR